MARTLGQAWACWLVVGALTGCGSAPPAGGPGYVRSAAGGYVLADPAPGMTVYLGARPLFSEARAAAASAPRPREGAR